MKIPTASCSDKNEMWFPVLTTSSRAEVSMVRMVRSTCRHNIHVKVKLSLELTEYHTMNSLIKHHAVKTYGGIEV